MPPLRRSSGSPHVSMRGRSRVPTQGLAANAPLLGGRYRRESSRFRPKSNTHRANWRLTSCKTRTLDLRVVRCATKILRNELGAAGSFQGEEPSERPGARGSASHENCGGPE